MRDGQRCREDRQLGIVRSCISQLMVYWVMDLALISVHVPIMSMESVCSVVCSDISVVSRAFITSVISGSVEGHALLCEFPDSQL